MRRLLVLPLLVAALGLPGPAEAAAVPVVDDLAPGDNWSWVRVQGSHSCVTSFRFYANVSIDGSAWTGAFWIGGQTQFVAFVLITQATSPRATVHVGNRTYVAGWEPDWDGQRVRWHAHFQGSPDFPICGAIQRLGFLAPNATDARVVWNLNGPASVVAAGGGADGFSHPRERFTGGAWAEAASWPYEVGASATYWSMRSETVPPGMIAAFVSTDTRSNLVVDGPFGQKWADCYGSILLHSTVCHSSTNFGALGSGGAAAGTYNFTVRWAASASAHHAWVAGAPFNWL